MHNLPFPDAAAIAALRARLQGVPASDVVHHYLPGRGRRGASAREILATIRQDLVRFARVRGREDLAQAVTECATRGAAGLKQLDHVLALLRALPAAPPQLTDAVGQWLPARVAKVLEAHEVISLADLTLRIPRSRRWWTAVPGLGPAMAGHIQRFFAEHPDLTEAARALVLRDQSGGVEPLERLVPRKQLDGSSGRNRAPASTCVLAANNDLEAVRAWLSLHESRPTQRAYRKEAERLMLWALVQLGKPLSSLTTEDAIAYRAFLRDPAPKARWVGPHRRRSEPDWRPFTGPLTPTSAAYALTVVRSLFAWLVNQRYLMANPFSGVKVRGVDARRGLAASRAFGESEWALVRTIANDLERSYGWETNAAHRARFILDFSLGTGLRPGELVAVRLGKIAPVAGHWWLELVGKGAKDARVPVPPLSLTALGHYLGRRGLHPDPRHCEPKAPLIATLQGEERISATRLWAIVNRLFETIAKSCEALQPPQPALADKLRRASSHWMRHTHATHALARGADLLTVRDNLRHASIATTSVYLSSEDARRAGQMNDAFG